MCIKENGPDRKDGNDQNQSGDFYPDAKGVQSAAATSEGNETADHAGNKGCGGGQNLRGNSKPDRKREQYGEPRQFQKAENKRMIILEPNEELVEMLTRKIMEKLK